MQRHSDSTEAFFGRTCVKAPSGSIASPHPPFAKLIGLASHPGVTHSCTWLANPGGVGFSGSGGALTVRLTKCTPLIPKEFVHYDLHANVLIYEPVGKELRLVAVEWLVPHTPDTRRRPPCSARSSWARWRGCLAVQGQPARHVRGDQSEGELQGVRARTFGEADPDDARSRQDGRRKVARE